MFAAINYAPPADLHITGKNYSGFFQDTPGHPPVSFNSIPRPAPETIDENGQYHKLKTSNWGTNIGLSDFTMICP